MSGFNSLSPEVAGHLGEETVLDTSVHPPVVHRLHYVFDGWLGDDIVETFPCYIVTERLALCTQMIRPSGVSLDDVLVSTSETFREVYPYRDLPDFRWLRVNGIAGKDDFGLSAEYELVISERVLNAWRDFQLAHCEIKLFDET